MRQNLVGIERRDTVAVLTMPAAGAASDDALRALAEAVRRAGDADIVAIVLAGSPAAFPGHSIEGAPEPESVAAVVAAIAASPHPVLAAIDGPALDGGTEIALACDGRIGSPAAQLGLTQTRLGELPGGGAIQRLVRAVGVARAIPLVADGAILTAAEAAADGLLDQVVQEDIVVAAMAHASGLVRQRLSARPVPAAGPGAIDRALAQAARRAKAVPAVATAIGLIRAVGEGSFAEGEERERHACATARASASARALQYLAQAECQAWIVPGLEAALPRPVSRVAVIGAGTMGAGIAVTCADAGLRVLLVERDAAAASAGMDRIGGIYARQVQSGRLDAAQRDARLRLITPAAGWAEVAQADLVIEAAFEDMAVKQDLFRRLDATLPAGVVLATNTSYLDLDAIAACTARRADVIGLHFFSPANVMKLLEIVRPPATAPDVVATALWLARRLGKQAIVAGVCDGFIGNRIYAVYRRHAEYLVEDGAAPEQVDAALEAYGFAMGIFAVSDLSGLDIAQAMRRRRAATRDPDERTVAIPDLLCDAGRLGRKTGAGWYAYDAAGKRSIDPVVTALIARARETAGRTPRALTPPMIQRRLIAVMANEGARELAEGIAQRASDIDVAFVNGYGFPRLQGGPMWAADRIGLPEVLREVQASYEEAGAGSEPAPLLVALAAEGGCFAGWRRG